MNPCKHERREKPPIRVESDIDIPSIIDAVWDIPNIEGGWNLTRPSVIVLDHINIPSRIYVEQIPSPSRICVEQIPSKIYVEQETNERVAKPQRETNSESDNNEQH